MAALQAAEISKNSLELLKTPACLVCTHVSVLSHIYWKSWKTKVGIRLIEFLRYDKNC